MKNAADTRIAWLFPSLQGGNYWHPIFSEFSRIFPQTVIYTGGWAGFLPGFEGLFTVEVVGDTKFFATIKPDSGYTRSYILPSWGIINRLVTFKPQVIFTSAFSLWTALSLLLKPLFRWRVIIVFDGVSTGGDHLNSGIRILARKLMAHLVDAFITNSQAGKIYLETVLGARPATVFAKTYLVPDVRALLNTPEALDASLVQLPRPIFLYVGQVTPRKGIRCLMEACHLLNKKGCHNYTLMVVGGGDQQQELDDFVVTHHLQDQVKWIGPVPYHCLGMYYSDSDVFVFPTLQDIWGMVPLEAMAFGKPIVCSKQAGSAELVIDGENGYLFEPTDAEMLAKIMQQFIDRPELIQQMGERSHQLIAEYNPHTAAQHFVEVTSFVLSDCRSLAGAMNQEKTEYSEQKI